MKKQNGQNRIIQAVTIGCVSLMACLCVGTGIYFQYMEKAEAQRAQAREEAETMVQEAGAVIGETKMAERDFLNRPAPPALPGDKRRTIHIVEIIPHEACSIFPYLVEWGSKEEYDKNTPLGYEGILYAAAKGGFKEQQFGKTGMYSFVKGGDKADTLTNYDVTFTTENPDTVDWWREAKPDENITDVNGYFEYVGPGKGLYSVNLKPLVKEGESEKGIKYRVMPMKRTGDESKKGEWEVAEAQYYWGKDYASATYPNGSGGKIESQTDFNYDLKFTADASGVDANYRVESVGTNTGVRAAKKTGFEYEAYWADTNTNWDGGFDYSPKGNYIVESYKEIPVNESTDRNGKYIRILNSEKSDDVQNLKAGYFRLYSDAADKDTVKPGDTLYEVNFSHTKVGEGSYILNPAAVQSDIKANLTDAVEKIFFEYAGEGLGTHDVVFIYAPSGGYSCEITEVSDGEGRYALTSTVADKDALYEQVASGKGDYSKVVTKIDCLGIDYDPDNAGWHGDGAQPAGVSIGRKSANAGVEGELGAWVFHTVSKDGVNEITKIEELKDGNVPANKRIYVYGQNRKNCYYARNTFRNNEWFKLLIYLGEEKGLAADAYASGKTGEEVLALYKDELEAFNRSYRIEIIQRTPDKLTVSEVNDADLIYMSEAVGIDGFAQESKYNEINDYIGGTLPPYENFGDGGRFQFTTDFSDDVLMALYENCMYHEEEKTATTAFLADIPALQDGVDKGAEGYPTKNNFGKLNYMLDLFEDPVEFAEFIQGYPENDAHKNNEDNYSTVLQGEGSKIALYPFAHLAPITYYNLKKEEGLPGEFLDEIVEEQWRFPYFEKHRIINQSWGKDVESTPYNGDLGNFMGSGSIYDKPVGDGWTYWAPDPLRDEFLDPGKMHSIWLIMHNKTSKVRSEPKVIVTNADYMQVPEEGNVATDYFIYVDEYEAMDADAFNIEYKVNWVPEEVVEPTPLSSLTVKRSDAGAPFKSDASPAYETVYSCNVAGDFAGTDGLNGAKMVQYHITATDEKSMTDTAVVWVIVRDSFMLN